MNGPQQTTAAVIDAVFSAWMSLNSFPFFFFLQKDSRHLEVKDIESKEEERSKKQYPLKNSHVFTKKMGVLKICF